MINILEEGSYLMIAEALPKESDFVKAADVQKGSYSERLVRRIYDHIFGGIVDVKREYQQYYSREYSNLMSFLYWKYDIDEQTLRDNEGKIRSAKFVGYAYSTNDGDHNLSDFLGSEVGSELLHSLFKRVSRRKKRP